MTRRAAAVVAAAIALAATGAARLPAQEPAPAPFPASPRDTTRRPAPDTLAVPRDSVIAPPAPNLGPFFLPALFYTPETGAGGGIGVLKFSLARANDPAQRPTAHSANLIITWNGQYALSTSNDVWTAGNRWHLGYDGSWSRFPNRFFGIGAQRSDTGEKFTPTVVGVTFSAQRRLATGIYGGLRYSYEDARITDIGTGGLIAAGVPGRDGWKLSTIALLASWDSRNRLYWPSEGWLLSATAARASARLGSDAPFSRLTLDLRHYLSLGHEQVLAVQGWMDMTDGAAPFDRLPQLGGSQIVRGYFAGLFRDRHALALQAEYRSPPFGLEDRFGVVAFIATGGTAPLVDQFETATLHTAGGVGLRFALTPGDRFNFRIDYGVGRQSRAFYLTVGEAF